jgi:hypothetical protein
MPDYSLVPVDHQPDFSDYSLVPVDYDPFSAGGAPQQVQAQPEQIQPAQGQPQSPPQQPATGVGQPDDRAPSMVNAVRGMFNPSLDEDKKIVSGIYDTAKNAFLAPGRLMQPNPYPPGSEEASWYDDQRQKAMIPAAVNIATLLAGFGLPMAERGAVGAFGGRLPRPPALRAAEKGYSGIGTTPNGGPTLAGTDHLYPAGEGQRSVVPIRLSGKPKGRRKSRERGGWVH